ISVLGTGNTVENFRVVSVNAEAADIALALGLASFDMVDGSTTVHNHGAVEVQAHPVPESPLVVAAAMAGIGTGTALDNRETGSLEVLASGTNALSAGMLVAGEDNTAYNSGVVEVEAQGAGFAAAVGLLAIDIDCGCDDEP